MSLPAWATSLIGLGRTRMSSVIVTSSPTRSRQFSRNRVPGKAEVLCD